MLSLIGSALGLFSSAIPKAMDMWQDKNDKAHELALLKAQAEITLDQTAIDASIREVESIHQHDSQIKGSIWVENTRALVRVDHGLQLHGSIHRPSKSPLLLPW